MTVVVLARLPGDIHTPAFAIRENREAGMICHHIVAGALGRSKWMRRYNPALHSGRWVIRQLTRSRSPGKGSIGKQGTVTQDSVTEIVINIVGREDDLLLLEWVTETPHD